MDRVKSFKGYDKVDGLEEAAFRKNTRKRIIILSISVVLLLAMIVGVVAGVLVHKKKSGDSPAIPTSAPAAIKSICSVTQYPESCFTSLASSKSSDPVKIFQLSLMVVMNSLEKISNFPDVYANKTDDPLVKEAFHVCGTVLNDAVDFLNDSVSAMDVNSGDKLLSFPIINNLKTWLSTVITQQETCFDALEEANATFVEEIKLLMQNSSEFASNSLAIVSKLLGLLGDFKIPINRRLLAAAEAESGDFPAWVTAAERRVLQTTAQKPHVTVAKDGTGDVRNLKDAVARIPKKSKTRFVIYVKAGVYVENVVLEKNHWNVMIYGDGKNATIFSGSKNFVDGTPTFSTATFAVAGQGFFARDIKFINTAGPGKHQAVALRSGSDLSVFLRCSFDAFQDTLYTHSNRQFYRECDITGTIDFIFGNSAVVFQNCNILPRQPMPNQFVTITAQGKADPNQNTGISIQRCVISPLGRLTALTYLGRPWKNYSTTVIMQSNIGGFLNSAGWISWVQGTAPPNTILYAEHKNTGPGASTTNRVKWAGYKPTLTATQALKYNVESFIQGSSWLPATRVIYEST